MDSSSILFTFLLALLYTCFLLTRGRWVTRKGRLGLPPGSMGIPFIGQSMGLLRAMRANTAEQWIARRAKKYGPVSKLRLFGKPTVFLTGQSANKFIFANELNAVGLQQPKSMPMVMGERNMLELVGEDYRRVRAAVGLFLKQDALKKYVGKIDHEVRHHLRNHWIGKRWVTVLPLMKRLTFDIICSVMFGLERGILREGLVEDFQTMIDGVWSVPINLPFTCFSRSLRARARARRLIMKIIGERRATAVDPYQSSCSGSWDLISSLTSISDSSKQLTDEEIVDNCLLVMIAGYDTSSILITFFLRHLANDPVAYEQVVHEQEEIARSKAPGEALTRDDTNKMKCTWRVALEILRMIPPVFGSFRRVLRDVEFGGYLIPKGWQLFWAASTTHMDADIFPDPSKFDPSRFEKQSSIPPYSFLAFGVGTRACPGSEFARVETLVVLHHLTTKFRWKLCCEKKEFSRDPWPSPPEGLPIAIELKHAE